MNVLQHTVLSAPCPVRSPRTRACAQPLAMRYPARGRQGAKTTRSRQSALRVCALGFDFGDAASAPSEWLSGCMEQRTAVWRLQCMVIWMLRGQLTLPLLRSSQHMQRHTTRRMRHAGRRTRHGRRLPPTRLCSGPPALPRSAQARRAGGRVPAARLQPAHLPVCHAGRGGGGVPGRARGDPKISGGCASCSVCFEHRLPPPLFPGAGGRADQACACRRTCRQQIPC
jgi:hypothetical protein